MSPRAMRALRLENHRISAAPISREGGAASSASTSGADSTTAVYLCDRDRSGFLPG